MSPEYFTANSGQELMRRMTARDLEILEYTNRLRFISGDQLARLCFEADAHDGAGRARTARRALLRLTRLGVLERLPRTIGGIRSGSSGYIYRVGLGGDRIAVARGLQPEGRRRRSDLPGMMFVSHALLVAELHTRLVEAERSRSIELLELSAEPSCWRSYGGGGGQLARLKPDSYVRLGLGPYEDSYFIEVDRGTEGTWAIERQLERYLDYQATGNEQAEHGVFPKVLWLALTAERAEAIQASVDRLADPNQPLFAVATFDQAIDAMLAPDTPLHTYK
jgi:hypothetical protein